MADNVSFKAFLKDQENEEENEFRRFSVDRNVSTSFSYLEEKLKVVFPQLKQRIFSVSWTDEDGDLVKIAADEGLIIALTEMSGPIYKLIANVKSPKQSKSEQKDLIQETQINTGVTSDENKKNQPTEGHQSKRDNSDLTQLVENAVKEMKAEIMELKDKVD